MSDVTRTSEPTVIVGDASTKIRDAHIKGGQVCCTCGRDSSLDCRTPPPDTCESNLAICRRDRDAARDERDELRKENKELKQERNCLRDALEKCRNGGRGCGCHENESRDRAQDGQWHAEESTVYTLDESGQNRIYANFQAPNLSYTEERVKLARWCAAMLNRAAIPEPSELQRLQKENETLRKIIADRDETVSRLATSCSKLDSKLHGCESSGEYLHAKNTKLEAQNERLQKEYESVLGRCATLQAEVHRMEIEVKRVNGDFDTVCKDLDDCRRKIKNQDAYRQDLQLQAEASHAREANTAEQLETIVGAADKLVAQRPGFGDPWTAVVPENFDALIRAVNGARQPLLASSNEATG